MIDAVLNFDAQALLWIQEQLRVPILNEIMVFFSLIGNSGLIWIATGLVLLVHRVVLPRFGVYIGSELQPPPTRKALRRQKA